MSKRKILTVRRRVAGCCWILFALAILNVPGLAWGQCNGFGNIVPTPEQSPASPSTLGTVVTVNYEFGANTVNASFPIIVKDLAGNLNPATSAIKAALDCTTAQTSSNREACLEIPGNDGSAGDDGDAIRYLGGFSYGPLVGDACTGVTFVSNGVVGQPIPNVLEFVADQQIQFQTNERCFIEFDVEIHGIGTTTETGFPYQTIAAAAGYDGECTPQAGADATVSLLYYVELDRKIEILKEVSVDGGATWHDADDDQAPFPFGIVDYTKAEYRLTVKNTGEESLNPVTITDGELGLSGVSLPAECLPLEPFEGPGDECVLTSGSTGFGALGVPGVCKDTATFRNNACADGTGALSGLVVQDCNEANVDCLEPSISIKKYVRDPVSPNEWKDAQDQANQVVYKIGETVRYQLVVCNDGPVDLEEVYVEDKDLGIGQSLIGALPASDPFNPAVSCKTLEEGALPDGVPGLDDPDLCKVVRENFLNIADADGYYGDPQDLGGPVEASDPANIACKGEPKLVVTKDGPPEGKLGDPIKYTICADNQGDLDLANCELTSDTVIKGTFPLAFPLTDDVLKVGEKECNFYDYTIDAADVTPGTVEPPVPDRILNTAVVTCQVPAQGNAEIKDEDDHEVDLFVIDAAMTKICRPDTVNVGDEICWDITLKNTGDKAITCTVDDPKAGINEKFDLVAGDSKLLNKCRLVLEDEKGTTISNTATADCAASGYTNAITACKTEEDCKADCFVPGEELCRTPGFWKTHAGVEKDGRSSNLTQTVIDANGGTLGFICGVEITDTTTNNYTGTGEGDSNGAESAVEGMCVHPKTKIVRQLQRQLIAASLNCVISKGGADCSGTSLGNKDIAGEGYTWKDANDACTTVAKGGTVDGGLSQYIEVIDAFNNGEAPFTCSENIRESDVWDDLIANGGKVPGPAGSPNACNEATYNDFYLVPFTP